MPVDSDLLMLENVGRDNRYMYMRDYADELQSNFEKTLRFIQDNPELRLTQAQKDVFVIWIKVIYFLNTSSPKCFLHILIGSGAKKSAHPSGAFLVLNFDRSRHLV